MKITVIGYWGGYPGPDGATSAYLLEEEDVKVLLDCGSGAVSKLQKYIETADLDALILTHYHHDHVADVGVLQYSRVVDMNLERSTRPLKIYGHTGDPEGFQRLGKEPYAIAEAYDPAGVLTIGPFTFTFQETSHPAVCYAIKVESSVSGKSFVYTGDTTYNKKLVPLMKGSELLIAEASFYDGQEAEKYGHMTSSEAARLAAAGEVEKLLLSHLPHFGEHKDLVTEAEKHFSGEVALAYEGLEIEIK